MKRQGPFYVFWLLKPLHLWYSWPLVSAEETQTLLCILVVEATPSMVQLALGISRVLHPQI